MTFHRRTSTEAVSDCGRYVIRWAKDGKGRRYFNGWLESANKHIAADWNKDAVIAACERHAEGQV